MKKLSAVFAALIILTASGCQKPKEAQIPPLPSAYSAEISIGYGDGLSMDAVLTRESAEKYGIDVVQPDILDPISFSFDSGEVTTSFDGITLSGKNSVIPQKDACTAFIEALTQVYAGKASQSGIIGGLITYTGTVDSGQFTLTRDAKSGEFVEFRLDGSYVDVIFKEYQ